MEVFLPLIFERSMCPFARTSRLLDQHFGSGLDPEDFQQPVNPNRREITKTPAGYLRRWRSRDSSNDSGSTLVADKDKFQASLDVQQFSPEELTIKITGENVLTVEGKHEEKEDQHGSIQRHFVRRYVLPSSYDISKIESKMSSDGVLIITAPSIAAKQVEHKTIPITQTEKPALLLDDQPRVSRRDLVSQFLPEETLHALNSVLNHLPKLEKDTSITVDHDHFQAKIDVQQFKPEEISVKLNNDNTITVEGKHEEKQDEHGFVSRHFVRRYKLPEDCDFKKLKSALSSDGVLSISAPKKPEQKQVEYKHIPIIRTGPIRKGENDASLNKA
ncbi:hypothetical protein HUJ04_000716 [Dendroctonus ponderosae]|nr:hypothetical protein HUJ04_000716 [Dendroctonus ponderosae]